MNTRLHRLLWDVDLSSFDLDRHAAFLVERVLTKGTWEEWKLVRAHYGDDRMRQIVVSISRLGPKERTFCQAVFGLTAQSFKCFTGKRSQPAPWIS